LDLANDIKALGIIVGLGVSLVKGRLCAVVASAMHEDCIPIKMAEMSFPERLTKFLGAQENLK
jgi:hypothetical protein